MVYQVDKYGKLILTVLHDNNDVDYCIKDGNLILCDEVTGAVEEL